MIVPMQDVTLFCFWASYLLAWGLELARARRETSVLRWAALGMTAAGLLAHSVYLYVRSRDSGVPAILASPQDWLLALAWVPVAVLLVSQAVSRTATGAYLLAPVLVIVSAAAFVSDRPSVGVPSHYWLSLIHAAMLMMGVAGITFALALSVMYLVQHRRLKRKQLFGRGAELLSLERLSRLNWWSVVSSVPLLTSGLALGVVLSIASLRTETPVPLTSAPLLIVGGLWLAVVPLLIGLVRSRTDSGRAVAWRTLAACGFLLGSLLVIPMVSSGGLHGERPVGEVDSWSAGQESAGRLERPHGTPGVSERAAAAADSRSAARTVSESDAVCTGTPGVSHSAAYGRSA